jgi:hypothetical protein
MIVDTVSSMLPLDNYYLHSEVFTNTEVAD